MAPCPGSTSVRAPLVLHGLQHADVETKLAALSLSIFTVSGFGIASFVKSQIPSRSYRPPCQRCTRRQRPRPWRSAFAELSTKIKANCQPDRRAARKTSQQRERVREPSVSTRHDPVL